MWFILALSDRNCMTWRANDGASFGGWRDKFRQQKILIPSGFQIGWELTWLFTLLVCYVPKFCLVRAIILPKGWNVWAQKIIPDCEKYFQRWYSICRLPLATEILIFKFGLYISMILDISSRAEWLGIFGTKESYINFKGKTQETGKFLKFQRGLELLFL